MGNSDFFAGFLMDLLLVKWLRLVLLQITEFQAGLGWKNLKSHSVPSQNSTFGLEFQAGSEFQVGLGWKDLKSHSVPAQSTEFQVGLEF